MLWHDHDISAGAEWEREISEQLNTAQIILLLISPDFMYSEYCYGVEMMRAMERHEAGEARVIPIIIRPTSWHRAPFGKLRALPTNAQAVTSKYWHSLDDAFLDVTKGIEKAVEELITSTHRKVPPVQSNPYTSWGMLKIDGRAKRVFSYNSITSATFKENTVTIGKHKPGIYSLHASTNPDLTLESFGDFVCQVEVRFLRPMHHTNFCGGIIFKRPQRLNAYTSNRYYYFSIHDQNDYSLELIDKSESVTLASGVAKIDIDTPIIMAVVAQGDVADLYLNLQHLTCVKDISPKKGLLGVAAGNLKDNLVTEVCFHNFMVWVK